MDYKKILEAVKAAHPDAIVPTEEGGEYLSVKPEAWLEVAVFLKENENLGFDSLMCITGFDLGAGQPLGIAYNFHSMKHLHKIEIRIMVDRDGGSLPSVANIWRTADWHEREAYDMYGMTFEGHPDHRRMLLPEDWVGHPLRKDYEMPDEYRGIPMPKDKRGWE